MGKKRPAHSRSVTCHLPKSIEQSLTHYCRDHDILRKDKSGSIKPSLAVAIVEILKRFFAQQSSLPSLEETSDSSMTHPTLTQAQLDVSLEQAIASIRQEFAPMLEIEESLNQLKANNQSLIEKLSTEIEILQKSIEENLSGTMDEIADEEAVSGMSRESLAAIFDEPET